MIGHAMLTLKQLRALAAVARHGSITAAAEAVFLSVPAVHSQIKGLEGAVGVPLLQRASDAAGSTLTPEGEVMLAAWQRMDGALSQALERVRAMREGRVGRVALGVVSTAKYFSPRLVKILRLLHPEIELVLTVGNRDRVLTDLENHAIDLAVMGCPPRLPGVEAMSIGPHPHGIIAASDHPLAGRAALSWADLRGETFIMREIGSGTRILTQRYLDRLGEGEPYAQVQMDSNETIKQAVIAGLGIAFLSLHTTVSELRHGELVLVRAPQTPVLRHWFLVHPTGPGMTGAVASIIGSVRRLNGDFLPAIFSGTV